MYFTSAKLRMIAIVTPVKDKHFNRFLNMPHKATVHVWGVITAKFYNVC